MTFPRSRTSPLFHLREVVAGSCAGMQDVFRSRRRGEVSACGDVIGMNVGIDDVADLHPAFFRHAQIERGCVNRVAHGGQAFATSTEHVRRRDEGLSLKQLPKDHLALPIGSLRPGSAPFARGSPSARQSGIPYSMRRASNPFARRTWTASLASTQ